MSLMKGKIKDLKEMRPQCWGHEASTASPAWRLWPLHHCTVVNIRRHYERPVGATLLRSLAASFDCTGGEEGAATPRHQDVSVTAKQQRRRRPFHHSVHLTKMKINPRRYSLDGRPLTPSPSSWSTTSSSSLNRLNQ